MSYPKLIENLLDRLIKLPGVGRRSAERIVFWMLKQPTAEMKSFAESIVQLKEGLHFCRLCNNLSDTETCLICNDPARDAKIICVVESPKDLLAIDRTGTFRGRYFVLLGVISPSEGRGPDDLHLDKLFEKIRRDGIEEVVIATDPDTEGEMTALYLSRELKALGVRTSRIGLGIPMGSSVEYADLSTLSMSLSSRRIIE